jgi:PAS domain S-box-containing protein
MASAQKNFEQFTKPVRRQLESLALALELVSQGATITDCQNHFLHVNSAFLRLYDYRREQVIGNRALMLNLPDFSETLIQEIIADTKNGGWQGELKNRDSRKKVFNVALRTVPFRDSAGKIIALVGICAQARNRDGLQREVENFLGKNIFETPTPLTDRESEIFGLLGRGKSTKEIAASLKISPHTVQTHCNHLREKMDCGDRSTLAFRAFHSSIP